MNKFLKFIALLMMPIILNAQIDWLDLGNTFAGFYAEGQSEKIQRMSNYSPLFGAMALQSDEIKNDWLKAEQLNAKDSLVQMLFHYVKDDNNVNISRRSSDLLLSITPELAGHLLTALEDGDRGWELFKKEYAPLWIARHKNAGREGSDKKHFFENIKSIKKSYDKFCHNNNQHKQKACEYFAAFACLIGKSTQDIKDYLIGLGITTIEPYMLNDFNISPQTKDLQRYEIELIKYLETKSPISLSPKIILDDVSLCVEQSLLNLIHSFLYNPVSKKLDLNYLSPDAQKKLYPELKEFIIRYQDGPSFFSEEKIMAMLNLVSGISSVKYNVYSKTLKKSFDITSNMENFIRALNVLFGTDVTSLEEFGKQISSSTMQIAFNTMLPNTANVIIKKEGFPLLNARLKSESKHTSFLFYEPEFNLSLEQIDELINCSKKINVPHSLISLIGRNAFLSTINNINKDGYRERMCYLIEQGVNINTQNKYGQTALHLIMQDASENSVSIIHYLLEHNANPNIQDYSVQGPTAFHTLFLNDRPMITIHLVEDFLIHGALINMQDNYKRTALNYLARKTPKYPTDLEILHYLIEYGASPDIKDSAQQRPLDIACYEEYDCNPKFIKYLIEQTDYLSCSNLSQLLDRPHLLDLTTSTEVGEYLIQKMDIEQRETILFNAARLYNRYIMEFGIENGIDINKKDSNGNTVLDLMIAHEKNKSYWLSHKITKYLIENGAYISHSNFERLINHPNLLGLKTNTEVKNYLQIQTDSQ